MLTVYSMYTGGFIVTCFLSYAVHANLDHLSVHGLHDNRVCPLLSLTSDTPG